MKDDMWSEITRALYERIIIYLKRKNLSGVNAILYKEAMTQLKSQRASKAGNKQQTRVKIHTIYIVHRKIKAFPPAYKDKTFTTQIDCASADSSPRCCATSPPTESARQHIFI